MSTDSIALFDAASEAVDIEWLYSRLVANPAFGGELVERYGDRWRPKAWAIENPTLPLVSPNLCGPGGFAILIK
jgi:hypothetical protein